MVSLFIDLSILFIYGGLYTDKISEVSDGCKNTDF